MTDKPLEDWEICPDCQTKMIGIEYYLLHPQHYDGVSEWRCPACGVRIGRWSGKRLAADEVEPRYGAKR